MIAEITEQRVSIFELPQQVHDSSTGSARSLAAGFSFGSSDLNEHVKSNAKLPYPMQLGTGTFDLLPGATYVGHNQRWSWGAQSITRFHLGTNSAGYRRGNRLDTTGWIARKLGSLSLSFRLNFAHRNNISGSDSALDRTVVPTADPALQDGNRLDALVGIDYHFHKGSFAGNRLALEFGLPAYQDLSGPQLEVDWIATLGWQYWF